MSSKKSGSWIESAIAAARSFSMDQPSEAERDEAIAALDVLIRALQDLRQKLTELPSETERQSVGDAAVVLERFFESMKARPGLAASLGVSVSAAVAKAPAPARRNEDLDALLRSLEALPTDEIQRRLLDEDEFTHSMLQALARKLGLPAERGGGRRDLVDRIVKLGFANKRGYDLLGSPRPGRR